MLSDQEKLERLDKLESYVCKANMIAMTAAGVAGAVMWAISKAKDRVLDRIWGG